MVRKNTDSAAFGKDTENGSRGAIFLDWPVTGETAVAIDECIDLRISNRPYKKVQRIAVKSLGEGSKFPSAHMSGEKEHALATPSGRIEIFVAIENDDALDIGARVFWELGKFASHPSDLLDHVANGTLAFFVSPLWEGELEIEDSGAAQGWTQIICGSSARRSYETGHGARQNAEKFEACPGGGIFERFAHREPLCGRLPHDARAPSAKLSGLKPREKSERRSPLPSVCVGLVIAICLFGQLGAIGLTGPDEPRYVWIARAMARTGDWVTPRLYGQPWFEKPILYYWAAAVGFRLDLPAEWAARLPSAFAAFASAMAIAWLARRFYGSNEHWGRNPALIAPLIFATSVAGIAFARAATPDMLFSTCIVLAMACVAELLWKAMALRRSVEHVEAQRAAPLPDSDGKRRLLLFVLLGAFLGVGTLAKGPAAVILAGGAVLLWALATRRWREALRLLHPAAIAAFCIVALPWYAICALRNPDFLRVFILQHNFERYLTPMFQHKQPFWFFGPIFLAALLPWTILLWPAAQEGLRMWREKTWSDSPGFFFACWAVFPILFFSASESKLPSYILPAIPPAALVCAVAGIRAFESARQSARVIAMGLGTTWAALAIAGLFYLRRINWHANDPFATTNGAPGKVYFAVALLLAAAAAMAILGLRRNARWVIGLCALCLVGSVEAANIAVLPLIEGRYSARPYAEFLKNDPYPDRIFTYQLPRAWNYGLAFYFGRELPEWSPNDPNPAFVLATQKGLAEIRNLGRSSGTLDLTQGGQQSLVYVPVNAAPRPHH